jgi:predicted amidohydrolase YtcJ
MGGGRIMALGSDTDMRHLAGPSTELVDLQGRLVTPGFIDTHIHFYEWALQRQGLKLDNLDRLGGIAGYGG